MKRLPEILKLQRNETELYRKAAVAFTKKELIIIPQVLGVLLTGSVARGDARKGPHGFMIDITIVLDRNATINLTECIGPSVEPPDFPFHAIHRGSELFAIELTSIEKLIDIRNQPESVIFAKQESLILFDRTGQIQEWKKTAFHLNNEEIKKRALMHYRLFRYLVGQERYEKWAYRKAWIQLAHNYNAACECFCSFLFCINGSYVPHQDWMVYLTYELPDKPEDHDQLIHSMYRSAITEEDLEIRATFMARTNQWMETYCKDKGWIT